MERDINKYATDYLNDRVESIYVKYRRRKVLEILNQYKPKRILEIGCGTEPIFEYYKDYEKYTIIEPSEVFCKTVASLEDFNDRIHLICGFLESEADKLQNESYDFILLSGLLHEVLDPDLLLERVHQLARANTIVHINVPNAESFHHLWAYEAGLVKSIYELSSTAKSFQRQSIFGMQSLRKIVSEHHFQVLSEGSYFIKLFNNVKFEQVMKENLIDDNLLDALYSMTKYFPQNGAEIFVNCKIQ